jgi:hypothetical protein
MKHVGHVACVGDMRNAYSILSDILRESIYWDVYRRVILILILDEYSVKM